MTSFHITDANDDEPGFIAARPVVINRQSYKLGDGLGSELDVHEDDRLFEMAEALFDGHCVDCDMLHDVCACEDVNAEFEERWQEVQRGWGLLTEPAADASEHRLSRLWLLPLGIGWLGVIAVITAQLTGWHP